MKNILVLILTFSLFPVFGQMPTDGDYSSWEWENQDLSNWKIKANNIWIEINPPFRPETERVGKIVEVYEASDYTRAKGWQLLWAQFDGIYPYFILYNSHKGLVRAFFYLNEQPFEHVLATLSFYDIMSPGILTYGNEYQNATDKYLNSSITSNDMISVVIPFVAPNNWCAADFPIFFDQNIQNAKYNSKKWVFKFYGCDNYQIHIKGQLGPASNEQQTITGSASSVSTSSFDATLSKLHKQLETNSKFMEQMQNSVKGINDSSPKFLQGYKNLVNTLKPLAQIFSAAPGISSAAGAVLGFLKVVNGTFDQQNSTTPAAVIQYLELEGTMDIDYNLGGTTLKIPGVNGGFFPPVSWNPFDCSMGYITLSKTPSIRKTTPYYKYQLDGDTNGGRVYTDASGNPVKVLYYQNYPPFIVTDNQPPVSGFLGKFVKYKFEDDNIVEINNIPGLSLVDINFALVVKLTGKGSEKFDITKKYISLKFWDDSGKEWHIPVVNPMYKALDEGMLKVYKFDEENDEIYLGTPELSVNKLKDIVFEVPEGSEIMLRVIAKFSSSYYNNPIVFQANYKMNEVIENAKNSRLVWAWEQKNYHWTDYYNGVVKITLSNSNSSNHAAGSIDLIPNFIGKPGFSAVATDIYPTRGNTQINYSNYACTYNNNLKSASVLSNITSDASELSFKPDVFLNPNSGNFSISSNSQTNEIVFIDNAPIIAAKTPKTNSTYISSQYDKVIFNEGLTSLYPNPTQGNFRVELTDAVQIKKVEVLNSLGMLVDIRENVNCSSCELSVGDETDGLYIVRIYLVNGDVINAKVIKSTGSKW